MSFLSDGWGGRVSDKRRTENSGLLKKIPDVILADRAFDIQESVGLYYAKIKIPAFTKGKPQLSGIEAEQTRHTVYCKCPNSCGMSNWKHQEEICNS